MLAKLLHKFEIAPQIFDFEVFCPEAARAAKPGQFAHVLCGGSAYLRRPISICDASGENIRLVFEVKGAGTASLSKFEVGDELNMLAPLGRGFNTGMVKDGCAVLVGGGIGTFPLLKLAKELKCETVAVLGYRTKSLITLSDDFAAACGQVLTATDDGSFGYHGFVTNVLRDVAASRKVGGIYTCGPKIMMKKVAEIAAENNIPCQVSMEQRMGCGVGACVTCVCSVRGENVRVCRDGPVFYGNDVDWA